ncbi:MAG: methionine ABC transporter substrate-binding protein, partial [Clostridia bacterium]|nr:methionine ABC transporter substrate-binding protein [Clostridia bacterium]
MKKSIAIILAIVLILAFAACGKKTDDKSLKVGASITPHAEILREAAKLLEKEGIKLEVVEYTDYVQPNTAVEDGSLDANYFQH